MDETEGAPRIPRRHKPPAREQKSRRPEPIAPPTKQPSDPYNGRIVRDHYGKHYFTFGKYRYDRSYAKPIEELMSSDYGYLAWAMEEIDPYAKFGEALEKLIGLLVSLGTPISADRSRQRSRESVDREQLIDKLDSILNDLDDFL